MKNIITLGASTSKKSINKELAEYTGSLLGNVNLIKVDLNNFEMPIYSVDIEAENGMPNGAKKLNELVESADGFIISFAEHNGAYSAAFKNAFDWLSRINGKVWREKPMLLLATSPGARGGQTVLDIALGRFPYMGGNIIGSLSVPSFFDNFKGGELVNSELKNELLKLIEDFNKSI
ncbi:NAD(P)H-dependent FMN reductase [Lutibacter oricola]|uniref:NAD(P)H-dependent FMN reductase n=1 Tax=Lutibacter oricola TaxID=762486 RepID=A0A1H3C656_9FLAO|nr:NADPH-dependent FMN reductase [Lutibacter oricola]SDX49555.1 NAD(P)H-dependent FMN reductase [Lutibacter oricola]